MPLVQIHILEGRSEEKVQKLIANVSHTVAETLEVPLERVRVLVSEVPLTHWGVAGKTMSELRKNE